MFLAAHAAPRRAEIDRRSAADTMMSAPNSRGRQTIIGLIGNSWQNAAAGIFRVDSKVASSVFEPNAVIQRPTCPGNVNDIWHSGCTSAEPKTTDSPDELLLLFLLLLLLLLLLLMLLMARHICRADDGAMYNCTMHVYVVYRNRCHRMDQTDTLTTDVCQTMTNGCMEILSCL